MDNVFDNYLYEAFAQASENIFIYVSDMKTDLSRWSKGAVDYFGLEDEYFYNAKEVWLEHVHPEDRSVYMQDLADVFSGVKEQHNCQYRAKNKQGEYVWVECRGSVIRDEEGNPIVFAGMMSRIDHQSKYDSLTHLLTGYELMRTTLADKGALMLIGIDNFRSINTEHGLVYGNKVLLFLAELLQSSFIDVTVYRFRGDEFAIYGKNKTARELKAYFDVIYNTCKNADSIYGVDGFSISGGIVEFNGESNDTTDILAKAELSIAHAKAQTNTNVAIFSEELEKKHVRRTKISEVILKSIKNNFEGFYLVFQPIIANDGKSVVGCESLLRWNPNNAEIGPCYPDEFISVLEGNGGIVDVGYFVMREAIKQASIWQKKYKKFYVSFNVSYKQLEDPKFVPDIINTVEKYALDTTQVIVELTESVLASDTMMVKNSFELLKEHGIQIALDDFGTGNSSFWTLHNVNIDVVKLDQTFIRGLEKGGTVDYAIVESVGIMCKRIGCKTIAEGVETESIWGMIKDFEFSGLQGYLFSKPVEVPNFEGILSQYNMAM